MAKDYNTDNIEAKIDELQYLTEISDYNKDLLTEFIQYLRADSNVSSYS